MSSQSLTLAPVIRTRLSRSPDGFSATIDGAPESLSDHRTCGSRRLMARLLASGKVGSLPRATTSQASGVTASSEAAASAVLNGRWSRAVSYTHLRAHETPEHLVCRLLLE